MMQQPEIVDTLREKYRFVDIVFGTFNIYMLAELLHRHYSGEKQVIEVLKTPVGNPENSLPERRKFSFKSGVNIMYGCNNFCTFCIVPYVRGRERSRIPEDIIDEVKRLAADGVTEVMLLGQNVNSYGVNFMEESEIIKNNPDYSFPELMADVCKVDGIKRVRFMTSHPKDLSDRLIEVIRDNPKVCRQIHLPVQSGSSRLLKIMNRRYTKEHYLGLIDKIRKEIPDVSISTDIMVGTFVYSIRSGTPAATMEQVPEEVTKERFDRLLKLVNVKAKEKVGRFKDQTVEVLVEDVDSHDSEMVTGRMNNNTTVHFKGCKELVGRYVMVKLSEEKGFYYIGEMVGQ